MDTRSKILAGPDAARAAAAAERRNGRRIMLLTGCFDPVLAEHACAVEAAAGGAAVFAAISDPPQPFLTAAARAELVAALRCVRYVVAGDPAAAEAAITPDETLHREHEDERLARELIRHVGSRQSAR